MKICNQCQKTFLDEEAFCDTCGAPLSPAGGAASAAVAKGAGNKTDTAKKLLIIAVIVLSVLTASTGIISVLILSEYNSVRDLYSDARRDNAELSSELEELENEVDFYQEHIALVNEDDQYYHKQGCDYFDDSSFWAYNTELAKNKGYSACPKCYGK